MCSTKLGRLQLFLWGIGSVTCNTSSHRPLIGRGSLLLSKKTRQADDKRHSVAIWNHLSTKRGVPASRHLRYTSPSGGPIRALNLEKYKADTSGRTIPRTRTRSASGEKRTFLSRRTLYSTGLLTTRFPPVSDNDPPHSSSPALHHWILRHLRASTSISAHSRYSSLVLTFPKP